MENKQSIVVLVSGSGSNLQAIIDASLHADSGYRVSAVISNKTDAYGLKRAENHGIPSHVIEHKSFDSREAFDQSLIQAIDQYQPKLVVLAGFMRILTPVFVTRYSGFLLNIHPSLLPKYQGLNTHQRALDAGDKRHGVSIHFVTEELDGGPVIMQSCVDINEQDNAESLQKKIHTREHLIYPLTIKWFCEQRVYLKNDIVYFDDQKLDKPLIYENLSAKHSIAKE